MIIIRVLSGIVATALTAVSIPLVVVGFGLGSFASEDTATLPTVAVSTTERVLEFGEIDLRDGFRDHDRWVAGRIDDVTIRAEGSELFLGVGPSVEVDRFVADGPGPRGQEFWIVQSSGDDPRVDLALPDGEWSGVVMNADGSPGVDADLSITIPSAPVRLAAGLVLGAGVVTGGVAALLFVVAFRRTTPPNTAPPAKVTTSV